MSRLERRFSKFFEEFFRRLVNKSISNHYSVKVKEGGLVYVQSTSNRL